MTTPCPREAKRTADSVTLEGYDPGSFFISKRTPHPVKKEGYCRSSKYARYADYRLLLNKISQCPGSALHGHLRRERLSYRAEKRTKRFLHPFLYHAGSLERKCLHISRAAFGCQRARVLEATTQDLTYAVPITPPSFFPRIGRAAGNFLCGAWKPRRHRV